MSRMVDFHNQNMGLESELNSSSWHDATGTSPQVGFSSYYESNRISEEQYAHPTLASYKLAHTD
jgi:hypothetical protein